MKVILVSRLINSNDMSIINFSNTRQMEGLLDEISPVKELMENKINLSRIVDREKRVSLTLNKVMRICFIVGLSIPAERKEEEFRDIQLSTTSARIVPSFFTMHDLSTLYSSLLKLRYSNLIIDWTQNATLSRIIAAEMLRGRDYLMRENNLDTYLYSIGTKVAMTKDIPVLNLLVGNYGDEEMEANLDINSRNITNSQIIIAGATGSGKTNLLAVLMQQFRVLSSESQYPVNFLLFDYKGEFSDIQNNHWLSHFDVNRKPDPGASGSCGTARLERSFKDPGYAVEAAGLMFSGAMPWMGRTYRFPQEWVTPVQSPDPAAAGRWRPCGR